MTAQSFSLQPLEPGRNHSFVAPVGAVTVVAYVRAKTGEETRLRAVTEELTRAVRRQEPGNLLFESHQENQEKGLILFYEVFKDQQAFQAHKDAPHTQRWFSQIEALAAGAVQVHVLENFDQYQA